MTEKKNKKSQESKGFQSGINPSEFMEEEETKSDLEVDASEVKDALILIRLDDGSVQFGRDVVIGGKTYTYEDNVETYYRLRAMLNDALEQLLLNKVAALVGGSLTDLAESPN